MCPKDRCLGSLHYNAVSDKVGWQTDKRPRLLLPFLVRDWSLIMGKEWGGVGGATKREQGEGGGHVKFYPYEKGAGGGAEKVLAMLKWGHNKFCAVALSFSHNEKGGGGGAKSFHSLKGGGGGQKFTLILRRGVQKVWGPQFSHFVAPLPVINDPSQRLPHVFLTIPRDIEISYLPCHNLIIHL